MKLLLPLDLQYFAGEKTEKATPKKRQDARKKGQVLKSQDVTAALLLLSHVLISNLYGTDVCLKVFSPFLHKQYIHTYSWIRSMPMWSWTYIYNL